MWGITAFVLVGSADFKIAISQGFSFELKAEVLTRPDATASSSVTKRFFSVRHDFLPKTTSKRHVWYPKIFKTTWFPTSFKPLIFLGVGVKRSFLLTNNLLIRKIYEKITFLLTSHQICKFQPSIYTKNQDHWTQRYNTVIAVKVIFFVVGSTTYQPWLYWPTLWNSDYVQLDLINV